MQQVGRLTGHPLDPAQIRTLLHRTARDVAEPAQDDRPTNVGPQVDLTAAVDALVPAAHTPAPGIARISVTHRVNLGDLEGASSEDTDPQRIDLSGDPSRLPSAHTGSGEGLLGPVTFGIDTIGISGRRLSYELKVG